MIAVLAVLLGVPAPASASCGSPPELEVAVRESDVVFVGVVTEVSNRQRNAIVFVEDVWKGNVGDEVEVRGGPQTPNEITSVDTAYREGIRYIFFPHDGSGDLFRDNACTSTQPYDASFEELRPAAAEDTTTPSPTAGGSSPPLYAEEAGDVAEPPSRSRWIIPGVLALAIAGAVLVWLRRREPAA